MAEMIFKYLLKVKGLEKEFFVTSLATSNEEARYNSPIYPKTKEVLRKNNIPYTEHRATQIRRADYDKFDYIIGMEDSNVRDILGIVGHDINKKVYKLLDFSNLPNDIEDPWYHRDFDRTFAEIYYGCEQLIIKLVEMKENGLIYF